MILIRNTLKCMHKMHNSKYNNDLVIIDLLINEFNRYFNSLDLALINLILLKRSEFTNVNNTNIH